MLQAKPNAGRTQFPDQQDPLTCPGRLHNVPFGVFAVQTHWPPEHVIEALAEQPAKHDPQLFGSDWMFTQAPLHSWLGALQAQSVPEQDWFAGQAWVTAAAHAPLPSHICFSDFVDPVHDCDAPHATVVG